MSPKQELGVLGMTFTIVRAMQVVSLISIIGMTANFISEMVMAKTNPHQVLIGTLVVTIIAVLYIAVTFIIYLDGWLPFLISTGLDLAILIALIVVTVTVGKPLSYLECAALPSKGKATTAFMDSIGSNMKKINYWVWVGANKTTCYEIKAIWGLSIALCILFTFSATCTACIWKRQKDLQAPAAKEIDV